jgi:outer membrane protein assembly factor BamE (lipoprotein component of BamABCDE complex)
MNHLTHFFGRECKTSKVKSLSAVDQEGIKQGVALKGMTREGVVLAMGIPPRHKTPSLDADSWKYWVNRFGTMQVKFDKNGLVSEIIR